MQFLVKRPEFAGIGKATAQRLWDTFGQTLPRIFTEGRVDLLAKVLTLTQAEIACDAWRNQNAIAETVAFFDEHDVDPQIASKVVDLWGDTALIKLRENPYRLLTICPWKHVDRIAQRLGIERSDPRRQVGAVEAALYERLDDKHTVTAEKPLVDRVGLLLGAAPQEARGALAAAVGDGAAIICREGYQPAGAAYAERFIEARIRAALELPASRGDLFVEQPTSDAILAFLKRSGGNWDHPLTAEQEHAVVTALRHRFSVLTGGAGVGKTTTLRAIIEAANSFGFHVHQLALAGRAAKRMSEASGRPAGTIASWLLDASNGRTETGVHTLVIVDEASMLDLPTLYRILFYLHEDARLLLVGDPAQLPPIGYGLTLHRLVLSPQVPQVELTRIMRADEETGIPAVSRAVRAGRMPRLPRYHPTQVGCTIIGCREQEVIEVIERVRDDLSDDDLQIIGATYGGPAGIDAINTHFHRYNAHGRLRLKRFAEGDPIIWTKNDYDRGLWNGSMGQVLAVGEDRLKVRLEGKSYDLTIAEFSNQLDLAYAISVHKAQGSQWNSVVLPLAASRLFDRALLYTALTRAKRRVVLVGDLRVLERAITLPPVSLARDVALSV